MVADVRHTHIQSRPIRTAPFMTRPLIGQWKQLATVDDSRLLLGHYKVCLEKLTWQGEHISDVESWNWDSTQQTKVGTIFLQNRTSPNHHTECILCTVFNWIIWITWDLLNWILYIGSFCMQLLNLSDFIFIGIWISITLSQLTVVRSEQVSTSLSSQELLLVC